MILSCSWFLFLFDLDIDMGTTSGITKVKLRCLVVVG